MNIMAIFHFYPFCSFCAIVSVGTATVVVAVHITWFFRLFLASTFIIILVSIGVSGCESMQRIPMFLFRPLITYLLLFRSLFVYDVDEHHCSEAASFICL